MPSYTPYVAHTRRVTARLRARMHNQSFTSTILASTEANKTDLSRVADARLRELLALRADHQRTFDPIFKQRALSLLQTLPLKAVADDPKLSFTMGALRVCGYFSATQSPATFNLLNHATRHSFLLDALSVSQLFFALEDMHHPQTAEVVSIVLPRVTELATEFTVREARLVLDVCFKHGLLTMELNKKLADIITDAVNDLRGNELASAVSAVLRMCTDEVARRFLEAATPRLCRALRETTEQMHLYKVTYLYPAGGGDAEASSSRSMLAGGPDGEPPTNPAMETPTERTLRHRKEEEWRQFLISQVYEGVTLYRELQRGITWLCWAPLPLLNEVVRCALLWSEPLLDGSPEHSLDSLQAEDADVRTSSCATPANVELTPAMEDRERYARDLPQVRRRSLCHCLKMLHLASYRHLPALRLLSARIAASKDDIGTSSSTAVTPELAQAVEAIAFFYATNCAPAVTAIVDEVLEQVEPLMNAPGLVNSARALSAEDLKLAERVVLRVLFSCARLLSTLVEKAGKSALETSPAQEEAIRSILAQATAIAVSPMSQAYLALGLRPNQKGKGGIDALRAQKLITTMHMFYAITVLLALHPETGAAPAASDGAASDVLRANLGRLVPWAQALATTETGGLPEEAAVEMAKALTVLKKRPEIMSTLPRG
ncbi:hypothetical protein LSCM1_01980 [Leishmania martiniquensis]|uniref:Mitochondrial RNA binding protein n=1 Tax=Leishmania martiniquensis TaxID=1580590 RepID=A0A836GN13_9TRYP|nr:hypothetical protein LSCM1_01980 [Leishmania martiniquensis]